MQGYILGTVFAAVELWWLSILLVLLVEVEPLKSEKSSDKTVSIQVGLVLYMRDSLVLMAVTFFVRSEKVRIHPSSSILASVFELQLTCVFT